MMRWWLGWVLTGLLWACSATVEEPLEDAYMDLGDIREVRAMVDGQAHRGPEVLELQDLHVDAPDSDLADLAEDVPESTGDIAEADFDLGADVTHEDLPPLPVPLSPVAVERSKWGGYSALSLAEGSGFFATAVRDDRAWLVDPDGYAFFSMGIQAVSTGSLDAPALGYAPGKLAQWSKWAGELGSWGPISKARLQEHLAALVSHGFNTVGGWSGGFGNLSGQGIAYSVSLGFAVGSQGALADQPIPKVSSGNFPDVFHPEFPAACLAYAHKSISESQAADPWNLGYYSDNELRWWGKDYFIESGTWTLADDFIDEPPDSPGKQAFVALMADRYAGQTDSFNSVYGTALSSFSELLDVTSLAYSKDDPVQREDRLAFVEAIAQRYFEGVSTALKTVAPNHLYLCARFASVAPRPVIEMAAQYCDVVTFNDYYILPDPIAEMALGGPPEDRWASYGDIVAQNDPPRPIIVTEWGIRADDSGLPNTFGAGFVVDTQAQRSDFYRFSADWFLDQAAGDLGFVAGWHWFMYIDEPPTGRFDGEDGNYGVTTLRDEKYRFLWEAMAVVNGWVDNRLVAGIQPTLLPPPEEVQAVAAPGGMVKVKWTPVPLATAYEVHILTHPAGLENRVVATHVVTSTQTQVKVSKYGLGTYWIGVSALGEDLLSMGPRISNPAEATWDDSPPAPELADALDCELLATVKVNNSLPVPNDEKGQTYAMLVPSFVANGEHALRLEFLPSSLGFVLLSPAGDTTLVVELALPGGVTVGMEDHLHLSMRPDFAVATDQQVVAASDFAWLSVVGSDGELLAQMDLAALALEPGDASDVVVPVTLAGQATLLRFEVDLFAVGLPLESLIALEIDQLSF
jgi:hypothetical protein